MIVGPGKPGVIVNGMEQVQRGVGFRVGNDITPYGSRTEDLVVPVNAHLERIDPVLDPKVGDTGNRAVHHIVVNVCERGAGDIGAA